MDAELMKPFGSQSNGKSTERAFFLLWTPPPHAPSHNFSLFIYLKLIIIIIIIIIISRTKCRVFLIEISQSVEFNKPVSLEITLSCTDTYFGWCFSEKKNIFGPGYHKF